LDRIESGKEKKNRDWVSKPTNQPTNHNNSVPEKKKKKRKNNGREKNTKQFPGKEKKQHP
jgi:hypothetical protein